MCRGKNQSMDRGSKTRPHPTLSRGPSEEGEDQRKFGVNHDAIMKRAGVLCERSGLGEAMIGSAASKSETRNSKAERNPKTEIRNSNQKAATRRKTGTVCCGSHRTLEGVPLPLVARWIKLRVGAGRSFFGKLRSAATARRPRRARRGTVEWFARALPAGRAWPKSDCRFGGQIQCPDPAHRHCSRW
jgi:hypothetical protein